MTRSYICPFSPGQVVTTRINMLPKCRGSPKEEETDKEIPVNAENFQIQFGKTKIENSGIVVSGAYLGIDDIPEDWVKMIEKSNYLDRLATRWASKKQD